MSRQHLRMDEYERSHVTESQWHNGMEKLRLSLSLTLTCEDGLGQAYGS